MNCPVELPRDLDEALRALQRATPETVLLAGGTDLMVEFESGRTRPDRVVHLWGVDELRGVADEDGGVRVGALTPCRDLMASALVRERADLLVQAAREVGAEQIQNRATLGGNLGTASPAADLNPVLYALGARVRLASVAGTRELPVQEFITGYRQTARRPDELIESVWIPPRPAGERRAFRKVGTRRAQSIAKVVVALAVVATPDHIEALRAAAGSVADRTLELATLERALVGQKPSAGLIVQAAVDSALHDAAPIDDVRSTAEYRRHVLRRLLESMLAELMLAQLPR